jgi:hypothetical protein
LVETQERRFEREIAIRSRCCRTAKAGSRRRLLTRRFLETGERVLQRTLFGQREQKGQGEFGGLILALRTIQRDPSIWCH